MQLCEAIACHGATKLINVGTAWQNYLNRNYDPVNLYAATKQAMEVIIDYYANARGVGCVTLRLCDTYGEGDTRKKIFNLLEKAISEKKKLSMSPGSQLIDFVYVNDVVSAFCVAAERVLNMDVSKHEVFAVRSGKPWRLRDVIDLYLKIRGEVVEIEWGGRPFRTREFLQEWDAGEVLPGWRPSVSLEEGLNRLITSKRK